MITLVLTPEQAKAALEALDLRVESLMHTPAATHGLSDLMQAQSALSLGIRVHDGIATPKPTYEVTEPIGGIAAWKCELCGGHTTSPSEHDTWCPGVAW